MGAQGDQGRDDSKMGFETKVCNGQRLEPQTKPQASQQGAPFTPSHLPTPSNPTPNTSQARLPI